MIVFERIKESILHFVFPHICQSCGTDSLDSRHHLCLKCLDDLPVTGFTSIAENPTEQHFWGRMNFHAATSIFYFSKDSMMQNLVYQVKYRRNKELGLYLGRLMGKEIINAPRFAGIDALVPLPLYKGKEKKRTFNQSTLLCQGINEVTGIPVLNDIIIRTADTESQTKKTRVERWENIKEKFRLIDETAIRGKHILLVDDVITTGATLESCGRELLKAEAVTLSIATLCFSSH